MTPETQEIIVEPVVSTVQHDAERVEVVPPLHEEYRPGPAPIATLVLIGVLLLVTTAFWMLVLGIQQGRA